MKSITLKITDAKYKGLQSVAERDKITVDELVQKQMDYYTDCIINDFIQEPVSLTAEQKASLNEVLAQTKVDFIASIEKVG